MVKNPQEKIDMFESALQPLFSNLESCIGQISSGLNITTVIQVHHSLSSVGTILKGFEGLPPQEFDAKFISVLQQVSQVVLITLESFIDFNIVREASQFCIVRLFILLSKLPNQDQQDITRDVLSKFIATIMNNFDKLKMTELVDLLNFVSQICHNGYNSQSIYKSEAKRS
ncbi:unnamed protein product [Ambrosiozyma monospora]|uniref:Unnamed protein product n=1 Tax=Ambrosiozyma monospora TaxID=43982 RepID=A0ACB5UB98_AMBMO|nr:unnamed protein product [Ambrosiozyma monospora]